jgi:hypothetical protein
MAMLMAWDKGEIHSRLSFSWDFIFLFTKMKTKDKFPKDQP